MTTTQTNPFATTLRAFHGDADLKIDMLIEIEKHRTADAIVQQTYYDSAKNAVGMQGCAVGCSIHSYNILKRPDIDDQTETSDHEAYETTLGIPRVLARLEDKIFEGLPIERARLWPGQFLVSILTGSCEPVQRGSL